MLKKAFTLIELLIVVAIIGIIVVGVAIALNPTQRIIDAQTANLRAQVATVGAAFDICMNYVNPPSQATNGYALCSSIAHLTSAGGAGEPAGGPFLKTTPTGTWTFQTSATAPTNLNGCVNSTASVGGNTVYAQFQSATNAVTAPPLPTAVPACP